MKKNNEDLMAQEKLKGEITLYRNTAARTL